MSNKKGYKQRIIGVFSKKQMIVAFLLLACWAIQCSCDSISVTQFSYVTNDPIQVIFSTSNTYSQIQVSINGIIFDTVTDTVNGLTGNIAMYGIVTCQMGPSFETENLFIQAITFDMLNRQGPTTNIAPLPSYTFIPSECQPTFLVPNVNPVQIPAFDDYEVTITTPIPLLNAYIALNGVWFCDLGTIRITMGNSATASCIGMMPCFLPTNTAFSLVGEEIGGENAEFEGPIVQLISSPACVPIFNIECDEDDCNDCTLRPKKKVEFTFQINESDDICSYSDFSIYASNPAFPSNIFVSSNDGELDPIDCPPTKYLIKRWCIPCLYNNLGETTFTLSYQQTFSDFETIERTQQITVNMGLNVKCNLSIFIGDQQPCGASSNLEKKTEGVKSVDGPCGPFCPGDNLNLNVHDASACCEEGSFEILFKTKFFSSCTPFQAAASALYFYALDLTTGALGYKILINGENKALNEITIVDSANGFSVVNYLGVDRIWITDSNGQLYCGSMSSFGLQSSPLRSTGFASLVSVGPTGVWVVDQNGVLWNKATVLCSDNQPFVPTVIQGVTMIASSASGVYYSNCDGVFHLTDPAASPQPIPSDGPSCFASFSGSNLDDSLAVIDSCGSVWILSSPNGTWIQTPLCEVDSIVNYSQYNLGAYQKTCYDFKIDYVSFGFVPLFNVIPSYSNLVVIIKSSSFNVEIYQSDTVPPLDCDNNALLLNWTIPVQCVDGCYHAVLTYDATYIDGTTMTMVSSVPFLISCPSTVSASGKNENVPKSFK